MSEDLKIRDVYELIEVLENKDIHQIVINQGDGKKLIYDRREKAQWIPCSERLPKTLGCYLVWRPQFFGGKIGMPVICYFDGQDTWHDSYGVDFTRVLNKKDVVAWMPLPEAYEESEDKE